MRRTKHPRWEEVAGGAVNGLTIDFRLAFVFNRKGCMCSMWEVHRYEVNGRRLLGWDIDGDKIKRDKESSILNDPNG